MIYDSTLYRSHYINIDENNISLPPAAKLYAAMVCPGHPKKLISDLILHFFAEHKIPCSLTRFCTSLNETEIINALKGEYNLVLLSDNEGLNYVITGAQDEVFGVLATRGHKNRGAKYIFFTGVQSIVEKLAEFPVYRWKDIKRVCHGVSPNTITATPVDDLESKPMHGQEYWFTDTPQITYSNWMTASSKVLLFYGKPGTGKSTYAETIIGGHSGPVLIVDDATILEGTAFLEKLDSVSNDTLVVIEDADLFISKRTDGNKSMSALLNRISGITAKNTRFVFITNLPSLSKIDEALLRPGRLYKAIEFKNIKPELVNVIREQHSLPLIEAPIPSNGMTLAEVMHYGDGTVASIPKVGF